MLGEISKESMGVWACEGWILEDNNGKVGWEKAIPF